MKTSDFLYELPAELIAQHPLEKRDLSRLLLLDKNSGKVEHGKFSDILEHINKGDCLVLNDTRVIPARLLGTRQDTGGRIEFVLLKRVKGDIWEVILKPGKRASPGTRFLFGNGLLRAEVLEVLEEGNRLVEFEYDGVFEQILDKVGIVPLPPYITCRLDDSERYQTVYSRDKGSAAAPTAGLHFTNELLSAFENKGVNLAFLTLHVGLGTFRPVKAEDIEKHIMHSEYYTISSEACSAINRTRDAGGRVIAVGTTSCRVLETVSDSRRNIIPGCGWTDIFIYPGYRFKAVDALITNFHLPGSTLIMLVSAFAGRENVLGAYRQAIENRYRFFSFGDAMLIR
ncbi:MAG: tRNA preQ1(34) S-adenosylmethionine ribosyltransferase-isomerase QueA [Ruminiclostridium sp.]|nr:tRNA preQ1(34) S-adenosylmethionine ribosyltransferase-isomerase QueA [Ruminiclostridium sp.]